MRKYRISKELRNYIFLVLKRQKIPYTTERDDTGQQFVRVPLSGERFHKVVLRARCEKLTKEKGILHLTAEEAEDPLFIQSMLPEQGGAFVTIGKKTAGA